eukprot:1585504-Pleurochrysis_carterae.AAC.5
MHASRHHETRPHGGGPKAQQPILDWSFSLNIFACAIRTNQRAIRCACKQQQTQDADARSDAEKNRVTWTSSWPKRDEGMKRSSHREAHGCLAGVFASGVSLGREREPREACKANAEALLEQLVLRLPRLTTHILQVRKGELLSVKGRTRGMESRRPVNKCRSTSPIKCMHQGFDACERAETGVHTEAESHRESRKDAEAEGSREVGRDTCQGGRSQRPCAGKGGSGNAEARNPTQRSKQAYWRRCSQMDRSACEAICLVQSSGKVKKVSGLWR